MYMTREQQNQAARIAFDIYIDCYFNYAEAARQLGIARSTVRSRVRRASLNGGGNRYSSSRSGAP